MFVFGIDLSGPSNVKDTACACFQLSHGQLELRQIWHNVADDKILHLVAGYSRTAEVIVGLDAPLSYHMGGGDRPSDRALRQRLVTAGLHPGSVMPPTMTRMAYLTLRGMTVARLLASIQPAAPRVVEVHPGGTMRLRGAPVELVRQFKQQASARIELLAWLQGQGLGDATRIDRPSDHLVAAYSAALAAWKWHVGESVWLAAADPPFHPFDFAC